MCFLSSFLHYNTGYVQVFGGCNYLDCFNRYHSGIYRCNYATMVNLIY